MNGGRVARTAGLVITTAIAAAAIQHTTWNIDMQMVATLVTIALGALMAAAASDFDGDKP